MPYFAGGFLGSLILAPFFLLFVVARSLLALGLYMWARRRNRRAVRAMQLRRPVKAGPK